MSIGFMVAEDSPMIWRGPMVTGAIEQMLRDVEWGELDILVCDLPRAPATPSSPWRRRCR